MGKQTLYDPALMGFYDKGAARHVVEHKLRDNPSRVVNGLNYMMEHYDPEEVGIPEDKARKALKKMSMRREEEYVRERRL